MVTRAIAKRVAIEASVDAGKAQSFSIRRKRTTLRLDGDDEEDLRYLWGGYAADLGVRSTQGAIEWRLQRTSPPQDVQKLVLEELLRHGGRAPEGKVIRILALEGLATRREVTDAIACLARHGKKGPRVERVPMDRPEVDENRHTRSYQEQQRLTDWTGYELRMTERGEFRMSLAGRHKHPSTAEAQAARWRKLDEDLEREWRTLAVGSETSGGHGDPHEEPLTATKRRRVNRATAALSQLTRAHAEILQCVFGRFHLSDAAELLAIQRLRKGITPTAASKLLDEASEAYRRACGR